MPDPRHYLGQLSQGHWFAALPQALRHTLLDMAQVQRLDAGQRLFRRGDKPSGLYAVVEGAVRVGAVSETGKEALLTLVEPPYWFGEISLFDGLPRTHDAFADSASTLLLLPQAGLLALLEREPQHWRDFALLMSHKLRLAFIALEDMSLLPAAPRAAPGPRTTGADAFAVTPDHQPDSQGAAGAGRGATHLWRDRDSRLRAPAPPGHLNRWPPATVQALSCFSPKEPYRCQTMLTFHCPLCSPARCCAAWSPAAWCCGWWPVAS